MKSPKLKVITLAICMALSQQVYAEDEAQPFTLSIKHMKESVDALILLKGDAKYISKSDLEKLYSKAVVDAPTITYENEEFIPLSFLGGLELDTKSMTALLDLNPNFMPEQRYSIGRAKFKTPSAPEAGQYLNYDFFHNMSAKTTGLGLSHRFSTAKGNFGQISGNFSNKESFSLVDANYNQRDASNNRILRFGTSTSSSSEVANSYRFFGVQVQSDRTLDPNNNDQISSIFTGTAEVQGTAELFVNGNKIMRQDIRPGDFTFDGLYNPMTTTGEATLLIRDVSGRLLTYSQPLLGTPRNLPKGYSTYSFESGYLRTNYNSLGPLFASGDYSYGLNDRVTLSGHIEATKDIQNFAAAATVATDFGTIKGGVSGGNGNIYNLGYFLSNKYVYANIDYKKYVDHQGIGANTRKSSNILTATGSVRLNEKRSINFSAIKTNDTKNYSVGSTLSLNKSVSFQATLSKDNVNGTSIYLGLNIPLGNSQSSNQYDSRNKSFVSELRNNRYELNHLDYAARYSRSGDTNMFNGSATLPTQYGDFGLDLSHADESAVRVRANGSVLKLGSDIVFSRRISDSYIIVDAKTEGVNINTSMGYRGKTDSSGKLVYPSASLGEHKIFMNNKDFPDDMVPMLDNIKVNPYPKSAKTVEVKILTEGFTLFVDTKRDVITINGNKFYKLGEEFYVDGLADGIYEFSVDGTKYTFNTKDMDKNRVLKATTI